MTVAGLRTPTFGECRSLGWRQRALVLAVLFTLLAAAVLIRFSGVLRPVSALPPLPGAAVVAPGVVRGGEPSDQDILRLRDRYGVRAIVDVETMDLEEQAVTRSLSMPSLALAVAEGRAPSADQILLLARFLRSTLPASRDDDAGVVYLHDSDGGGPVLVVAAILQLLRGTPSDVVFGQLPLPASRGFTSEQQRALREVAAVVEGRSVTGRYAALRGVTW
jgi:hypothetical protein